MRYKITFSYDGSKFYGYQKQNDKLTVQSSIEGALEKINEKKVAIYASGRTDRGVHAINQTAHFDLSKTIPEDNLKRALNSMTDEYIYIKNVKKVEDDFHARFDASKKEYIYLINELEYNPIEKDYVTQVNQVINIRKVKKAQKYLVGEHDFTSFIKDNTDKIKVRKIYKIKLKKRSPYIIITFVGNGFMRYQIRNMVGALIQVGLGYKSPKDVKELLNKLDKKAGFKTAPPNGLYLNRVYYKRRKK